DRHRGNRAAPRNRLRSLFRGRAAAVAPARRGRPRDRKPHPHPCNAARTTASSCHRHVLRPLPAGGGSRRGGRRAGGGFLQAPIEPRFSHSRAAGASQRTLPARAASRASQIDRKSTRLNSSHVAISYAVFCLKKKKRKTD